MTKYATLTDLALSPDVAALNPQLRPTAKLPKTDARKARSYSMNKKDAMIKARAGMTAGDLREILNKEKLWAGSMPSKVNPRLTKRMAWDILHDGIANCPSDFVVDKAITFNVLREFA